MEVMLMIGRYAGEIKDVRPHYALSMIERGEAIDINAPIITVPKNPFVKTSAAPVVPAATKLPRALRRIQP